MNETPGNETYYFISDKSVWREYLTVQMYFISFNLGLALK